ncbi:hypothetical protein AMECASPLE_033821 [Ameca splendens]|uniref:Uncharacterized protein n=1 Tax=Ameca splendens TaxID=208324 RepID=A0ABV0XW69_9TELE
MIILSASVHLTTETPSISTRLARRRCRHRLKAAASAAAEDKLDASASAAAEDQLDASTSASAEGQLDASASAATKGELDTSASAPASAVGRPDAIFIIYTPGSDIIIIFITSSLC